LASVAGDTLVGTELEVSGEVRYTYLQSTNLVDPSKSWKVWYGTAEDEELALSNEWIVNTGYLTLNGFPRSGPTPERCRPYPEPTSTEQWCDPAWSRVVDGAATVPVVSGDGATVFVGDSNRTLTAVNIDDGAVRWTGAIGGGGQIVAAPTVGDGLVFVTSSDGRLTAFDADGCGSATCPALWSTATTGSAVRTQSALAGGVVYVGSDDGSIRAFGASGCGAAECEPLWQTSVGSAITGAPAVTVGRLVVGTADGRLIAFRPEG
jgi:outer membrane protein assembly factor BamB